MQEIPSVIGFTAGELSPRLSSRFDLQAYQRGAARICNFMVMPYGGLRRRAGTRFIGNLDSGLSGETVRLFPFSYAAGDALMLLLMPGKMHVYRHGQFVVKDAGVEPYELELPWTTASQLQALRLTQINDVLYACCDAYPPVRICRRADDDWTCETAAFEPFPRETYQTQSDLLQVEMATDGETAVLTLPEEELLALRKGETLLADAEVPTRVLFRNTALSCTCTACPALKTATVEAGGMYWIRQSGSNWFRFFRCIRRYTPDLYNGSDSPEDYPLNFAPGYMLLEDDAPIEICGDWELHTNGEWNMSWEIWRSYNTTDDEPDFYLWDWERIGSFEQSSYSERKNWALTGSETRPCRIALVWTAGVAATAAAFMYLKVFGGKREYRFRITELLSDTQARAAVESNYLSNNVNFATRSWSRGAFGPCNGYPAFSALYQGRLWLGGIPGLPTTLIASSVDDYSDFRVGSDASSALHLTISSDDQSCIMWMCASRQLLLGTSESEWVLSSADGASVTASSATYTRQSSVGSESQRVGTVENTVLFLQRGGKRLREISYKLEADGFTAGDLSLLAEHLFESGVKEWCIQRGTDFHVWVLMQDGTLAVLTMNTEQQVTAWQRVELAGRSVLHVAALPSAQGADTDELWLLTQTENNGTLVLEYITDDSYYVDLVRPVPVGTSGLVKNLTELAGQTVMVWQAKGGTPVAAQVAEDGTLTLTPDMGTCLLGVPYSSELDTLPLESLNSFNSVRQFSRVRLRLLNSTLSFRYKSAPSPVWEQYSASVLPAEEPFTGSVRLAQMPDAGVGQGFSLRCSGTEDFCLLGLTIEVDHHGK